jgi:hypothetical protein
MRFAWKRHRRLTAGDDSSPQTGAEMIANMVPVFGGTIAVALTVALNQKLNERRELS